MYKEKFYLESSEYILDGSEPRICLPNVVQEKIINLTLLRPITYLIYSDNFPIRIAREYGNCVHIDCSLPNAYPCPKFVFDDKNMCWVLMTMGVVTFMERVVDSSLDPYKSH